MSETTNLKLKKHDNPSTNENEFDIENYLNSNWDKLDTAYGNLDNNKVDKVEGKDLSSNDFTNEYKQKLDELENYDDTAIKEDITELQNKNTEQDKEITNLQNENAEIKAENKRLREDLKGFPSNTAEGEYITLNDSADSRFNEFKIKGNSKQKTRSGKNILPTPLEKTKTSAGITFTINDDGSITLNGMNNGTGSSSIAFYNDYQNDNNPFILKKETKYTVSGMNDINVQLVFYNGTIYANLADRTFTTTETNYSYESIYLQISKGNTTNFDNYTIYPMLEEGSVATEYEQYGASPSTKFPSKIQNVEGDFEINITNKNIFNCNKWMKMTQT